MKRITSQFAFILLSATSVVLPSRVAADISASVANSSGKSAAGEAKADDVISAAQLNLVSDDSFGQARGSISSGLSEVAEEEKREPGFIDSITRRLEDFFSIKTLSCTANSRISCSDIEKRLSSTGALSLWNLLKERVGNFSFAGLRLSNASSLEGSEVTTKSNVREILTENPWVEDAQVKFSLFGRSAEIKIREAIPWFITELRKANWVVSRRGALLQEVSSITDPSLTIEVSQLPRVRGIETRGRSSFSKEGEKIRIITQFLGVINVSGGFPFEVESYELLEDDSIAITPLSAKLPTVFIRSENLEDTRSKIELLKNVLSDSKSRGEQLQRVDLRFRGRAVVVREPIVADSLLSKPAKLG